MFADDHMNAPESSRLFHGDRLVEVDGINVENASREEIVARIKNAGDQVTLLVQQLKDSDQAPMDR